MVPTVYVVYTLANGTILSARIGDSEAPPTPGAGEGVLNAGVLDTLPVARTHRVALGPPPTLAARTQSDMDAEKNAALREELRRSIGVLEAVRGQYVNHNWGITALDVQITALLAKHNAIP